MHPSRALPATVLGTAALLLFSSGVVQSAPPPPAVPLDRPLPEPRRNEALSDYGSQPLALREVDDPEPLLGRGDPDLARGVRLRRGILLTPYQRVALYGRGTHVKRRDPAAIEELARPELWIVVFPYAPERSRALVGESSQWRDDPRDRLDGMLHPDSEVLWPEEVSLTDGHREVEPLWVRRDDFPFAGRFYDEWIDERSLVAAYPLDDPAFSERSGRISVEYRVDDQPVATESATISWRNAVTVRDWHRALAGR